jgi:hypothetical protein
MQCVIKDREVQLLPNLHSLYDFARLQLERRVLHS